MSTVGISLMGVREGSERHDDAHQTILGQGHVLRQA